MSPQVENGLLCEALGAMAAVVSIAADSTAPDRRAVLAVPSPATLVLCEAHQATVALVDADLVEMCWVRVVLGLADLLKEHLVELGVVDLLEAHRAQILCHSFSCFQVDFYLDFAQPSPECSYFQKLAVHPRYYLLF